jgi:tetratricopeptide (TPR) repeat protein
MSAKSAQEFAEGIRREPGNPHVHFNYAHVLALAERLPEAIGHYRAALRLDPHRAGAHHNLGAIYQRLGMRDEATAELRAALREDPALQASREALRKLETEAAGKR